MAKRSTYSKMKSSLKKAAKSAKRTVKKAAKKVTPVNRSKKKAKSSRRR